MNRPLLLLTCSSHARLSVVSVHLFVAWEARCARRAKCNQTAFGYLSMNLICINGI